MKEGGSVGVGARHDPYIPNGIKYAIFFCIISGRPSTPAAAKGFQLPTFLLYQPICESTLPNV
jgi:hypothetical protein